METSKTALERFNQAASDFALLGTIDRELTVLRQLAAVHPNMTLKDAERMLWDNYQRITEELISRFETVGYTMDEVNKYIKDLNLKRNEEA